MTEDRGRRAENGGRVDPEYRKMMTWVGIALVASLIAAIVMVEVVIRLYDPGRQ